MIGRLNQQTVWIVFVLIIMDLALVPFFSIYLTKNNTWHPDPVDEARFWLSDQDYQAIGSQTKSSYTTRGGHTIPATMSPTDRALFLAAYQIKTPDGQWHGRVVAKSEAQLWQLWGTITSMILGLCILGLVVSYPRSGKNFAAKLDLGTLATH